MLIITKLLFSALFGMMIFFSGVITPIAFKHLPEQNLSVFLRKIFPKLFAIGFIMAITSSIILYFNEYFIPFILSTIISLGFILNLVILTPKINFHKDNSSGEKNRYMNRDSLFFTEFQFLFI